MQPIAVNNSRKTRINEIRLATFLITVPRSFCPRRLSKVAGKIALVS